MAKYQVTTKSGTYEVETASSNQEQPQAQTQTKEPFLQRLVGKNLYSKLSVPREKAKEGLNLLSSFVPNPEPTGQEGIVAKTARMAIPALGAVPKGTLSDIVRGTPKIGAEAIAQTAPEFVSPESIATTGALSSLGSLGKVAKTSLKWLGETGENFSNIKPGALEAAYKDTSLIFSASKAKAGKLYQEALDKSDDFVNLMKDEEATHETIIETAKTLAKENTLSPTMALMARKSLDTMRRTLLKSYPEEVVNEWRKTFDTVAKQDLSKADQAYRDALNANSLRKLFPQNKTGGASPFRMFVAQLFGIVPGGEALSKVGMALTSPVVQGGLATGAGVVGRYGVKPIATALSPISSQTVPTQMGLMGVINKMREKRK